jgi:hypothetical protein
MIGDIMKFITDDFVESFQDYKDSEFDSQFFRLLLTVGPPGGVDFLDPRVIEIVKRVIKITKIDPIQDWKDIISAYDSGKLDLLINNDLTVKSGDIMNDTKKADTEIQLTHTDVTEILKDQLATVTNGIDTNGIAIAFTENEYHGMLLAIAIGNPAFERFQGILLNKQSAKDFAKLLNDSADIIGN